MSGLPIHAHLGNAEESSRMALEADFTNRVGTDSILEALASPDDMWTESTSVPRADEDRNNAFHQEFLGLPEAEYLVAEYECYLRQYTLRYLTHSHGNLSISDRGLYYSMMSEAKFTLETLIINSNDFTDISKFDHTSNSYDTAIATKFYGRTEFILHFDYLEDQHELLIRLWNAHKSRSTGKKILEQEVSREKEDNLESQVPKLLQCECRFANRFLSFDAENFEVWILHKLTHFGAAGLLTYLFALSATSIPFRVIPG